MSALLDAFRATVARRPDAPATHYFDDTVSFAQLDAQSDALAASLQDGGLRPGDRVSAYLQNVPQFFTVALATWKAGGTLVATSPMLRHKELRHVLDDSGATVLVTLERLWHEVAAETVADTDVRRVITTSELDGVTGPERPRVLADAHRRPDATTDDLATLIADHAGRAPRGVAAPGEDDVAILTYTSGTTGPAKGAMNTHGNLLAGGRTYQHVVGLTDDDVILGSAPLFHITGLTAHLAVGLLAGIPTVLTYRFDPGVTLDAIERHRTTFTVMAITAYVALTTVEGRDLSSLRHSLSGGAPIAPALAEAWERHSGVPLRPVYGLTETTGPTHMVRAGERPPVDPASGALSVGRAVDGTTVTLLGPDGEPVVPGTVGEIAVAGPQVVPGYWGNPEETENAFGPYGMSTGDVGVVDADGWLYVVDRKKDLINASGYKVWPREVEDGLLAHPAVHEAAVVGVPDSYRGESVLAFVSLRPGQAASSDELIAFCRDSMAAYKYPRRIEILPELPKNASGKILRRVLRDRAVTPGDPA